MITTITIVVDMIITITFTNVITMLLLLLLPWLFCRCAGADSVANAPHTKSRRPSLEFDPPTTARLPARLALFIIACCVLFWL